MRDTVNLASKKTSDARRSRDWLIEQIRLFPDKDSSFPILYPEKNTFFGSFARNTKKRPLDDIDLMICLSAMGGTYYEQPNTIEITVHTECRQLTRLCYEGTQKLHSVKVVNKFISLLNEVPQYQNATIKRNQEAATLKLNSYEWNFDIVPCFFTSEDSAGNTYYLIPDGNGGWKKTDPRRDAERVKNTNQLHDGNVLDAIRILKYWNKRPTMPSMSSYLLESMVLDFYNKPFTPTASKFVDIEVPKLLAHIKDHVYHPVEDPKGIQGDINQLSLEDRGKIWSRANEDLNRANKARQLENEKDFQGSIFEWSQIFGSEFPSYG